MSICLQPADLLVLDVSGFHATQLDDEVNEQEMADNVTVIHIRDLHRLIHQSSVGVPQSSGIVLRDTMVLYVHRSAVRKGYPIIDIIPSLKTLYNNEKCSVSAADNDVIDQSGLFDIDSERGTHTLKFTGSVKHRAVYKV